MDIKVKELINSALANIKEMVDANTVTGEPIVLANGVTIIPVSKVSCGFAAGGSDLPNKSEKEIFGGGTGGGVTVSPLAFICVSPEGEVQLLQLTMNASASNAVINMVPEVFDKISSLFKKDEKASSDIIAEAKEQ